MLQKRKPLDVVLLIFKIVIPVFLVFLLVFFSVDLYKARMQDLAAPDANQTVSMDAFPLTLAVLLVVMLFAAIFALLLSLIGLAVSLLYRRSLRRKKHILAYSLISLSCPAAFLLFLLIGVILSGIGG